MHTEVNFADDAFVVAPEDVLRSATEVFAEQKPDQVLIAAMKNGKYEIFSSHSAEEAENMLDDAFDALYDGEIGFDDAE